MSNQNTLPPQGIEHDKLSNGRLLLLYVPLAVSEYQANEYSLLPLEPTPGTSFGSRIQMSQSRTLELYESLKIHPSFCMNMLGRPDYWAPVHHWDTSDGHKLQAFGV